MSSYCTDFNLFCIFFHIDVCSFKSITSLYAILLTVCIYFNIHSTDDGHLGFPRFFPGKSSAGTHPVRVSLSLGHTKAYKR